MKIKNRTHIVNLKKISTVAFVMILILFNSINQGQGQRSQNKESLNDWTKEGLKGKVKSYTQCTYEAFDRFGKIEKGEKLSGEQMIYNEKGNLIEENHYSNGIIKWKNTYKYDEKENLIEENRYWSDTLYKKHTYKYDEKGNLIEANYHYYSSDSILDYSKYTYKYDEKGNLTEGNRYLYGILDSKTIYKRDEKGNLIAENVYSDYGDGVQGGQAYEYDEKGNLIAEYALGSLGQGVYGQTYEYDKKGNLIETNQYLYGRLDEKCTYKNDKKGNLIEMNCYDTDDILVWKVIYKYDKKGNLIEEKYYNTIYDDEGNISSWWERYTFQYDEQQNWTKKIEFIDEVPKTITEREYQYYE